MEAVRDLWTDERMDDLNHRVDTGFAEVGHEFRALRLEMRTEFTAVRSEMREEFAAGRLETKAEFAAVRSELAELQRFFIGMFITLVVGFGGVIATMLTQN
jgi:hypothetical protein